MTGPPGHFSLGEAPFGTGQRINHIQFAARGACLITPKIRPSEGRPVVKNPWQLASDNS